MPEDSIEVDDDGNPVLRPAASFDRIDLKDKNGRFFPVCPFFELHGEWTEDGAVVEGPITKDLLDKAGLGLDRVRWSVALANLKAYHYTLQDADRVEARVEVSAADTRRHDLNGLSPQDVQGQRLVPGPRAIKLGQVQAIKLTAELSGLRLRVYAPAGVVYAPTDIEARIAQDNVWQPLKCARRAAHHQSTGALGDLPHSGRRAGAAAERCSREPAGPCGHVRTRIPKSRAARRRVGRIGDLRDRRSVSCPRPYRHRTAELLTC